MYDPACNNKSAVYKLPVLSEGSWTRADYLARMEERRKENKEGREKARSLSLSPEEEEEEKGDEWKTTRCGFTNRRVVRC